MNFKYWTPKKMMGGIMLFKKYPRASEYSGLKLIPKLGVLSAALLLASCGADVSDETAMQESLEVSLAQCEILQYGVVGTATDPVQVNGEEFNACLLNKDIGQLSNTRDITNNLNTISLKQTWNYKPLVWVLDGVYEFGESKEYETLDQLLAERVNFSVELYAKPGSVVILHRNAQLTANILSLDDNNTGGGEWGGVVINGIGYSPECPATSSPDQLCNIKGPFGYYGGVAKDTDLTAYGMSFNSTNTKGFPGLYSLNSGGGSVIGEAGEEVSVSLENYAGGTIHAAVTAYAPAASQTGGVIAYSGSNGLQVHGGSYNIVNGNPVSPIPYITNINATALELNNYQGDIAARIRHDSLTSALVVKGGQVNLSNLSLFDQYNQAGVAISVASAAKVTLDDALVQGFDTCLAPQDSASQISVGSALFNCSNVTNNTSNALAAIADATDLITGADALLSYIWAVGNSSLNFANVEDPSQLGAGNASVLGVYSPAILFPECMGVGTLAEDTLVVGGMPYQICDLTNVDQSATLYSNFSIEGRLDNGGRPDYYPKNIAWRINGQVQVGTDFAPLNSAERAAALASPVQLTLPAGTTLLATSNNDSELLIQPDARLRVAGSADAPVALGVAGLTAGDITSGWRGITVNGADDSAKQLDIQYLRLYDTGEDGQAAFTLNEVGADSNITYLDIYGAGADGLNINGGAANFDHLVMANIAGDQIQWQNGYQGTIETAVISPGDNSTGAVLHGINNNADYDAMPRSRPVITNITAAGFGSANTAVLLEQGTGLLLFNSVFSDFATCLDIDDAETAALQSSDPLGILFDGVIFSCENTLAADSEDSGYDYGYTVASSGGVYEEDPVLDTSYVITGDTLASQASLSSYADLIGDAYNYLKGDGYIGAVADSDDDWYVNWSDSVVIAPDEECDGVGILTDLVSYTYDSVTENTQFAYHGTVYYPAAKYCRILGGTYTEDITLGEFSGAAREAYDARIVAGDSDSDARLNSLTSGWAINASTGEEVYIEDAVMELAPTHWTIKGVVHIGNGNQEITDTDTVADMKANPVTFTMELGIELTPETDSSVLHITRAGALQYVGNAGYEKINTGGVSIAVVIDGFGRNNLCENAATTNAGEGVCNIEGPYGYYGGYDPIASNVDISGALFRADLTFNSVNGVAENSVIYRDVDADPNLGSALSINGGSVNFKNINIDIPSNYFKGVLTWNHGYQGNLANIYVAGAVNVDGDDVPLLNDEQYYPLIYGRNNSSDTDAEPRSMPTIANLSVNYYSLWQTAAPRTTLIQLAEGSGLFMYNSLLGADESSDTWGEYPSECVGVDSTNETAYGSTIFMKNIVSSCLKFTVNSSLDTSVMADLNAMILKEPYLYYGGGFDGKNKYKSVNSKLHGALESVFWKSSMEYPVLNIIQMIGERYSGGYSESATADSEFLEETKYIGVLDYYEKPEIIGVLE